MRFVTTETRGDEIYLTSPYYPIAIDAFRNLGGRWTGRTWVFDARNEALVREVCLRHYGEYDAPDDLPRVTCRVSATAVNEEARGGRLALLGRVLAQRPGRDVPVRLGVGVVVAAGRFQASGGSVKNPLLAPDRDIELLVHDVPQALAEQVVGRVPGVSLVLPGDGGMIADLPPRLPAYDVVRAAMAERFWSDDYALRLVCGILDRMDAGPATLRNALRGIIAEECEAERARGLDAAEGAVSENDLDCAADADDDLPGRIYVSWSVGDVESVHPDLTATQCAMVLLTAKRNHDAEVGINWDVLRHTAAQLFGAAPPPEEEKQEDA